MIFRRPFLVATLLATTACPGAVSVCAAQAAAAPSSPQAAGDAPWWKDAVLYEIYPRSFQDSNGDGIGDLNGITQRLDYLRSLGVNGIWLTPVYPSPQVDFGYDISDYTAIDPQYGTLNDFDRLVAEAGKRHIRVLMDMVMNHTSDQHAWFTQSAASRDNDKRDWYVWRDAKGTGADGRPTPPNNWTSLFGGSAWEWSAQTGQFYYHRFYKQQPDLNWHNPQVEKAMFAAVRFWLDRGVAGFRLDAVPSLFEDPQMRDETPTGGTNAYGDANLTSVYVDNLPQVHGVMRRLRTLVDTYPGDRVLIGETYLPNVAELDKWYGGAAHDELHLPMDLMLGFGGNRLDATRLRVAIVDAETGIHGSEPLFAFENHDNPRVAARFGDGVHDRQITRLIATLLLTTHATALLYYGEELGMPTTPPTRVEDVKDPIGVKGWPKEKGRDGERTPMQWTEAIPGAGFTTSTRPWLPLAPGSRTVNVATEETNQDSLLNWHKQLIALKASNLAMHSGTLTMLNPNDQNVLAYLRSSGSSHIVVAMNLSPRPQVFTINAEQAGLKAAKVTTLMASDPALKAATTLNITLPPYASWIAALQ